ncbi:hypothetical protein Ddye_032164 [Dipteronia dyeriana]|uniref:Reverse transcriptase domain-containing protein n=1 Tax=Dipteronia dyeriana TaxID=168575 RepID=A0AAD9TJR1_9ROSI|nr:hypothetical protein Ddye_032164 [Dipteronia dyeriana]
MAFVWNHQILDSFVMAEEIIHQWKKSKEGGFLVKLDFEKAHDSLYHNFLDDTIRDMGFGEKWRQWIRNCISSPSLSVLVNGSFSRQFKIQRGLRQRDPLSPFLFNVAVEGLSALFKKAEEANLMKGVIFGKDEVHVSYLQFADDTILFLQPNIDHLVSFRRVLRCFKLASGLRINFQKSFVVEVGKNREGKENWAGSFRCTKATLPITYLGLKLVGCPGSKIFWTEVLQRLENHLAPWKKSFLNKSGRLVLIKVVMSSIPIYFMSMFKIPVGIAIRVESLQRSFFFGDGGEKRRIHAVK